MVSRVNEVLKKKESGKYNCAQSVACAYADIIPIKEEILYNAASAFGGGLGTMEGTCGSIIGAGLIVGLKYKDRLQAKDAMKYIMNKFKERNGCTICKQLKGIESNIPIRKCNDCVTDAAQFLEEIL